MKTARYVLEPAQLVHEDKQDADGADILHAEEIEMEETAFQRTPVIVFVANQLVGKEPTDKQTGEESADRQEQLSRDKVKQVEEAHAPYLQLVKTAERKGTEGTDDRTAEGDNKGCRTAGDMDFFVQECRAYLVKGYEGGKGCQRQQCIEKQGDDIAHYRHGGECLVEHIGQGDEYQGGT